MPLTLKVISRAEKLSAIEKVKLKVRLDEKSLKVLLEKRKEDDLLDQYSFRIRLLGREEEELTDIITHKPMNREYDEENIGVFLSLCDRLIGEACSIYGISEKEAQKIRKQMLEEKIFIKPMIHLEGYRI